MFFLLILVFSSISGLNKGQFKAKCGHKRHEEWTAGKTWKLTYTSEGIKKALGLTRKQRICDICMIEMKSEVGGDDFNFSLCSEMRVPRNIGLTTEETVTRMK